MATTRSKKLRRSAARKGKRVVRPKKVTYRGLFHGSMANLSRRDKFGPRPIPQKIYKDEMAQLAVVVGKTLPRQDWVRRYCNRHIQAAITDGYLLEHEGGALSVTPKARFRYRNARRVVRESLQDSDESVNWRTTELCRQLDKEVGPTSLKTRAELVAENRALAAKLNGDYTPPRPLQAWNSLSTVTNADIEHRNADHDFGYAHDDDDDDNEPFECAMAGPSTSPMAGFKNPYPSPESLRRESRVRTDQESAPVPPTPCPGPSTLPSQHGVLTPISPSNELVAGGRVDFVTEKMDIAEDEEDVLMLDMPGPCNLTVKFSAASLERRIRELENDVKERDETVERQAAEIVRLTNERDEYARLREELQDGATASADEHERATAALNALIAARDAQINALQTDCIAERAEKEKARADLVALQARFDAESAELRRIERELAECTAENRALEAEVARLQAAIDAADSQHKEALRELKEEYEVKLQLQEAQLQEGREIKRELDAHLAAFVASMQSPRAQALWGTPAPGQS